MLDLRTLGELLGWVCDDEDDEDEEGRASLFDVFSFSVLGEKEMHVCFSLFLSEGKDGDGLGDSEAFFRGIFRLL